MELLFESRLNLKNATGKLNFFQHKPDLHPDPVLQNDTPTDRAGASIYGSVLHDGGQYRMWYQAWPEDWGGKDTAFVGYAESDDGISWRKPALNLVDQNGTKNNLCNLGFHAPSVFIDPNAPDTHRYRATGCSAARYQGGHADATDPGYYTAYSADGLHWELDSPTPTWLRTDVITSVYHPGRQQAQVALKYGPRLAGFRRRSIWTAARKNGVWTEPCAALIPDDFDDVCALTRGFASGDYYGMGMQPAGQATVGFLWQFRHSLPRTAGHGAGVFGATDISLVYQANEGDCWVHMPGRPDFLTHNTRPWARGGFYSASNVVEAGDEHRLYLTGANRTHAWYLDADWKLLESRKQQLIHEGLARIGMARWPKWRLFGFRADPEGSIDINLGPISQPCRLALNFETEPGGSLRVQLLSGNSDPLESYTLEDAIPLSGNHIGESARWKNNDIIHPTQGKPVIARLSLDCASIYAYELRPVK